jgi:hypothetical protein
MRKNPSLHANAQPITTPAAAAGKVRGRIANPQACKVCLVKAFSPKKIAAQYNV